MVNLRFCLVTLSLVTLTFALQPCHVMSTEATIIDVCSQTPDPDLCKTCLHTDPSSGTADIRGLAIISIGCGKRDAYKLFQDTYDVSQSPRSDPALKDLTGDCFGRFHLAADYINSTVWVLENKGVDSAKGTLANAAMAPMSYCEDLFKKKPEVPVPKTIIDEMNGVVTDIQIMLGILNRIVRW